MGTFSGDLVVEVDYPLALANASAKTLQEKKFRYVHLGGALSEHNQEKTLWFSQAGRRGKVFPQTTLLRYENQLLMRSLE
jgi:hypothetical protein